MPSIVGIGVDLVCIDRIAQLRRRHGLRFLQRVFTPEELRENGLEDARDERLATRFAAKEAVMKALGTGWGQGVGFKQIIISSLPSGQPVAELRGTAAQIARSLGAGRVLITMSNEQGFAIAVAILEAASEPAGTDRP